MLTRRSLIAALGATACAPALGPLEYLPPTPLALGWRLAPGDLFALVARTERNTAHRTELRTEEWTYRVLEIDRGIARIEARVTALGSGVRDGDTLVHTTSIASAPTELALGRDGRLHGVSDPALIASLPHYALAVALPTGTVAVHDEWADPIGEIAARLFSPQLEATVEAHTELRAMSLIDGRAIADLETRGRVTTAGPRLDIAGRATWDLLAGRLLTRTLEIRPSRLGDGEQDPGLLTVSLTPPAH